LSSDFRQLAGLQPRPPAFHEGQTPLERFFKDSLCLEALGVEP
jgi:hypothetical protein